MAKGMKTGGRKKGTPNKLTAEVKRVLEEAFDALGGVGALTAWAQEHQTEFYRLWAKLLPKDVSVSGGMTLEELVAEAAASEPVESPPRHPSNCMLSVDSHNP